MPETLSKARILYGKLSFFHVFGGGLSKEIVEAHYPEEGAKESFLTEDYPKLVERETKNSSVYNKAEYNLKALEVPFNMTEYCSYFTQEEMEAITNDFVNARLPINLTALYKKAKKETKKKKA